MKDIFGIISGKGGVGKTFVSINLATSMAHWYGKEVLLIDCNISTSHVGLHLGLYSTPTTLNDALKGIVPIEKTIYKHKSGIDVIPASLKAKDFRGVKLNSAREVIDGVLDKYNIIILDSAPGLGEEAMMCMDMSDRVLLVTNPIIHSAADLIKCRDVAREEGMDIVGIVSNMVRKKKYELSNRELEELVEVPVICSIPYDENVIQSMVSKEPIVLDKSKVTKRFKELCEYILGDGSLNQSKGQPGIFRKFIDVIKWF